MDSLFPILLVALALAAIVVFANRVLPITRIKRLEGRNARNSPIRIEIDPTAQYPAAVWAQEFYESRHKLGALVRPLRLWKRLTNRKSASITLELMGHEVEVQAAVLLYGVNEESYRETEAAGMRRHPTYYFGDWPEWEIEKAMKQRTDAAQNWVWEHLDEIKAFRKRLDA